MSAAPKGHRLETESALTKGTGSRASLCGHREAVREKAWLRPPEGAKAAASFPSFSVVQVLKSSPWLTFYVNGEFSKKKVR